MRTLVNLLLISMLCLTTCKKGGNEPKEIIPLAPSELTLAQVSGNQIKLNWKDNSNNETGFKVERISPADLTKYQLIGSLGANSTTFTDNTSQSGSHYTYRVYSYNSVGSSSEYSNEETIATCPIVNTADEINSITASSARIKSTVNCDGGFTITSRGIVWSTSPMPTVSLPTKTSDGTGLGLFWSDLTNLSMNTSYYVRAYATNSFGTTYGNEKVFKTANSGTTVAGGNGAGGNNSQLSWPLGVALDKDGNIYVADTYYHRVQKWASGAASGTTFAGGNGPGPAPNQLYWPSGVCIDATGNIYIVDYNVGNYRVQKWAPGASSGTIVASGISQGQLNNFSKYDVFVDGTGNVYVTDFENHRVQKWAPGATSGTTVAGGNGPGSAANQLDYPTGVYVDAAGNIYVADLRNHRIQKWTPGATIGTTVAGGNGPGYNANQLANPTDVFMDSTGNIYITEGSNYRVQKWTPGATSGKTVAGGSGDGSSGLHLRTPMDLIVDSNGNIYIADLFNYRVQKWSQ